MRDSELSHDDFFKFSHRPFEDVEVKGGRGVKFWYFDLFKVSYSGNTALNLKKNKAYFCMTNGSKVISFNLLLFPQKLIVERTESNSLRVSPKFYVDV